MSAGKVFIVGLASLLALGAITVLSVPGLSKPIRGFFKPADLDITAQQNLLVIQGRKGEGVNDSRMLHLGIAQRGFERRFELADYVRVDGAKLEDGLLIIDLVREVPEAMKPKKIEIAGSQTPLSIINGGESDKAA